VNENDSVTIKTNGQNIRSNKQVKNNLIKDSCLYIAPDTGMCSSMEIKSDSFYLPIIRRDVRQYVKNKKPNGVVCNSNILINGLQAMFCEPILFEEVYMWKKKVVKIFILSSIVFICV